MPAVTAPASSTSAVAGADPGALGAWLDAHVPELELPVTVELIAGGRSNLTYLLTDARGRRYALRRPPSGEVLPGAHDMRREWAHLSALRTTSVPVPRARALCTDRAVADQDLYVMEHIDGLVLADEDAGHRLALPARARAGEQAVDVLAELHAVVPAAVGLDTARPAGGFVQRQLARWSRQMEAVDVPERSLLLEVRARLAVDVPDQTTGIVHGDFRPGNLSVDRDGSVLAVFDWELATVGDTLVDLGWLLAGWREPGEDFRVTTPGPTALDGFPRRQALVDRYAAATGRDLSRLPYYTAFARWRVACIAVGVRHRYASGVMGDDGHDVADLGTHIQAMGELARDDLAAC